MDDHFTGIRGFRRTVDRLTLRSIVGVMLPRRIAGDVVATRSLPLVRVLDGMIDAGIMLARA